jgi:hypothetical protein
MKLTRRSPMDYRQDSADIEFSRRYRIFNQSDEIKFGASDIET